MAESGQGGIGGPAASRRNFRATHGVRVLNVAGSRAGKARKTGQKDVLDNKVRKGNVRAIRNEPACDRRLTNVIHHLAW